MIIYKIGESQDSKSRGYLLAGILAAIVLLSLGGYFLLYRSPPDEKVLKDKIQAMTGTLELMEISHYPEAISEGEIQSDSAYRTVKEDIKKLYKLYEKLGAPVGRLGVDHKLVEELQTGLGKLKDLVAKKSPLPKIREQISKISKILNQIQSNLRSGRA